MTTYRIVSASQKPPGAGEINAGQTISVSPGDVFIIESSADKDITFASAAGGPHVFEVIFNTSNTHGPKITVGSNLKPTVTIADNTNLDKVDIDAQSSNGLVLTAGDNASLGKLDGSKLYADTITAGDNFTATGDWNTTGGDDVITIGDGADFTGSMLKTGVGNDAVTFGDNAQFGEIDTEDGNDTIRLGDGAIGEKVIANTGDDTVRTGAGEDINTVDGGAGFDSYTAQDSGTSPKNFETKTIVCFMKGTKIRTQKGEVLVEDLAIGDQVWTMDNGFQPLHWIGRFEVGAEAVQQDEGLHPVRIRAGALGPNVPQRDLYVSQHHRVLIRSKIAQRMFGQPEVLVAAKKLIGALGIAIVPWRAGLGYYHLACAQHEIVAAEGMETESLLLAPEALKTLDLANCATLRAVTEVVLDTTQHQQSARPIIQARRAIETLVKRSRANGKPLQNAANFGLETGMLRSTSPP